MSLKKKIILGFFISASIIAVLVTFEYINFIEIRKEIRYLEITDTLRSKSLQLRRHEKNFFLRGDIKEIESVYDYLRELKAILRENRHFDDTGKLVNFQDKIFEYEQRFNSIEKIVWDFQKELVSLKSRYPQHHIFYPVIEATFLERPLVNAELIKQLFHVKESDPAITNLLKLNEETLSLIKDGEEILAFSKEIDKTARDNAERVISISQVAILIFFPLFVIVGVGIFFYVISSIVKRLELLMNVVEQTGEGHFVAMSVPLQKWASSDEVGILIKKFNHMEEQLSQREKELIQSKKLAAIGTLASGVAHELNNPLNNIYTTAQRLLKKTGEECPSFIKKGLEDIFGQTARVKQIVSDLLGFARGREPQSRELELNNIITSAYQQLGNSVNISNIKFLLDSSPEGVLIFADPEQMEQVFINLFSNAIDAMSGNGELGVKIEPEDDNVRITVSDTGKGMTGDNIEKIFEPFFSTKDKGTGLGLAIVYNIITKHNGSIKVESEIDKGTSFTITLPKGQK